MQEINRVAMVEGNQEWSSQGWCQWLGVMITSFIWRGELSNFRTFWIPLCLVPCFIWSDGTKTLVGPCGFYQVGDVLLLAFTQGSCIVINIAYASTKISHNSSRKFHMDQLVLIEDRTSFSNEQNKWSLWVTNNKMGCSNKFECSLSRVGSSFFL